MDADSDLPSLALPEPLHMLDRDQLETFATVVEQQSFDRAASVLSITRGAVSQRIKALEESLSTVLVKRERPVAATHAEVIDFGEAVHFARTVGLPGLLALDFQQRAARLKALA